jgi:hypothetical protein
LLLQADVVSGLTGYDDQNELEDLNNRKGPGDQNDQTDLKVLIMIRRIRRIGKIGKIVMNGRLLMTCAIPFEIPSQPNQRKSRSA